MYFKFLFFSLRTFFHQSFYMKKMINDNLENPPPPWSTKNEVYCFAFYFLI